MTSTGHAQAVREAAAAARQLRDVADAAQADYMRAVVAAMDAGVSVADLARAAGVTRTGLYQALRKHRAREFASGWERARKSDADVAADRRLAREMDLHEYRWERDRQEREIEEVTRGGDADYAEYLAHGGKRAITYADWMRGKANLRDRESA